MSGGNAISAIILEVAVCVGIGQCADMMGDLKSGHLIGSIPRKSNLPNGRLDGGPYCRGRALLPLGQRWLWSE